MANFEYRAPNNEWVSYQWQDYSDEQIHAIASEAGAVGTPAYQAKVNELIDQIESDVYTSDLTKWLHSHNENVCYLTEALEETDIKDGFQLLAYAQEKVKREVFYKVAELITKEDNK